MPTALLLSSNWHFAWTVYCGLAVLVTIWTARTIPGATGERATDRPRWLLGSARLLLAAATMGAGSAAVWIFARDLVVTTSGVAESTSTRRGGMAGAFTGDLVARVGLGWAWVVAMLLLAAATTTLASAQAGRRGLTGVLLVWGSRIYTDTPAFGVGTALLSSPAQRHSSSRSAPRCVSVSGACAGGVRRLPAARR